jgi:hypothetical protein
MTNERQTLLELEICFDLLHSESFVTANHSAQQSCLFPYMFRASSKHQRSGAPHPRGGLECVGESLREERA